MEFKKETLIVLSEYFICFLGYFVQFDKYTLKLISILKDNLLAHLWGSF